MLKEKKLFLLDMDGTIYHENKLIEGTLEFFKTLEKQNKSYIFITNNSSKNVETYIEKINSFGIKAEKNNFFTASQATVEYLKINNLKNNIFVVGTNDLKEELKINGISILEKKDYSKAEVLLVGFDTELNYEKLDIACKLLYKGVKFIATNLDIACPITDNRFIPDCGAICGMLESVTGKKPYYIGKPNKIMLETILNKTGKSKNEVIIIGDRLYTDIALGINGNVDTIAVLTGETTIDEINKNKEIKPTYVYNSIKEILEELK